jgi:PAS domain S-box-containing protein
MAEERSDSPVAALSLRPDLARITKIVSILVGLGGIAALIGWAADLPALRSVLPGYSAMKPNTAIAFILSALILALTGRPAGAPLSRPVELAIAAGSVLVAAMGAITMLEYAAGLDLGVDRFLLAELADPAEPFPGRMSPISAAGFLLFGILMLLPRRSGPTIDRTFTALAAIGLALSYAAIVGYGLQVPLLYAREAYASIALSSAIMIFALFLAASATRPALGWVALMGSRDAGGAMARRLLPIIVIGLPAFAWVRILGERAGLYDTRTGIAILTVTSVAILTAIVWAIGLYANRLDRDRRATMESLFASEERQRASEQRYRRLFDLMQEAVWVHEDGKILFANPAAVKLFGADSADAVIGRSIFSIIHPDDRQRAQERTRSALKEGLQLPITDLRYLGLDGVTRIGASHALPVTEDGHLRSMATARDVTAQRQAEQQLRHSQKLESVGQLTGGMAHDFNNLLTVILGNLDTALARTEGETRRAIQNALQASELGATLIQRLLAFSRQQALAPQTLNANELVTGLEALLRRTLGEHIEIELRLGAALWPALADKGQLESAILNLAVNARDAMPDGGKLTIETANAHLDETYAARNNDVIPGDYVMLAVSDTGTGMSPEVLERAMEPFFTTKEVGRGSGLGLSMIYGFAKQSQGHMKIYSEVGIGTTVRLYLPHSGAAETVEVPAAQPAMTELRSRGETTVLAVEDDAGVRNLVVSQLARLGYRVMEATNGLQALALLASEPKIDLLFTDMIMPGGMTGKALVELARAKRPGLKVLFTSGYTENASLRRGAIEPGVHFLAKPYKLEALARKVQEALADEKPAN